MFHPQKENFFYTYPWRKYKISIKQGNCSLSGWFLRKKAGPVIIYFGGNAENVSLCLERHKQFPEVSLYLMNYPGYNENHGKPSEKTVLENALATYDYLIDKCGLSPESIYLVGRSIGSSVAAFIAANRDIKGLILITPFDSLFNVSKSKTPFLLRPFLWVVRSHFNTLKYLEKVNVRTMAIFAGKDELIPQSSTDNVSKFLTGRASINVLPEANHQNISDLNDYYTLINDFILEA